jgi:hypothetical protein
MRSDPPGSKVSLEVEHGGEPRSVVLTLKDQI